MIVTAICISITACEIRGDKQIENSGIANFYITTGSVQSIVLKAQQNIIDVMTYVVTGETLKVGLLKNVSIQNHEEISFDIVIPSINRIDLDGVENFFLSGADQDALAINLVGVGNVNSYDMRADTCTIFS